MGLFSDIYNTVARFFRPQDEQEEGASKAVATNRLKLDLMQDRTNLTPKILEQMRGELIDLLSKYLEMDKELLELNFEQEGDQVALMLSIPVIRAKDEDEIEEAIKASREENSEEIGEEENSEEAEDAEDAEDAEETEENNEDKEQEETVMESSADSESDSESKQEPEAETPAKPKRKNSKKVTKPEGMDEAENNKPVSAQEPEETNVN